MKRSHATKSGNEVLKTALTLFLSISLLLPHGAAHADADVDVPLVRSPGVSQEHLEAFAEAQGRITLADYLDNVRSGNETDSRLARALEKGQTAWLAGSIDSARSIFKEIAKQAIEADWREPQREAIHYAMVRLAQSASLPTERNEWLERAIVSFPDLQPDPELFPPPLVESFRATRSRVLKMAKPFAPYTRFPDHRYLLINGRRFVLTPDLSIRLPNGTYRVTVLSDSHLPVTEKLSLSQMAVFKLSSLPLASGNCEAPGHAEVPASLESIDVYFGEQCIKTRTRQGWSHAISKPSPAESLFPAAMKNSAAPVFPVETPKQESSVRRGWMWAGVSVLAAGAAFVAYRELSRERVPEQRIEPVHKTGF